MILASQQTNNQLTIATYAHVLKLAGPLKTKCIFYCNKRSSTFSNIIGRPLGVALPLTVNKIKIDIVKGKTNFL